jgi:predicted transcriptional regulator
MQTKKVEETEEIKNKKTSLAEKEAKLSPAGREIWEGIKEGLEDVKHGRLIPFEQVLKELREEREEEERKENKKA